MQNSLCLETLETSTECMHAAIRAWVQPSVRKATVGQTKVHFVCR